MFDVRVIDGVFALVVGISEVEWEWGMGNEDATRRRQRVGISNEERGKVKVISLYYRSLYISHASTEIMTPPAPRQIQSVENKTMPQVIFRRFAGMNISAGALVFNRIAGLEPFAFGIP